MAAAVASQAGHLTALRISTPALASTAAAAPPAGGPVATLSGSINLLENTHAIIKLDGFDTTPGATMTAYIIYVSNAGTLFQVNPDGTRGALIGQVTGILGVSVTNPNLLVWYEPNPDFFGQDGFQYYIKDNMGGQSFLQTISLSTHHVNQGPRAVSTTHFGVNDATITGIVLNVSDPDPGQQFQGKLTHFPNAGKLYTDVHLQHQVTPANPTFTGSQFFGIQLYYTFDNFPNPGTDAFSYVVSDGVLSSPETTDFINIQFASALATPGTTPPGWATIENGPLQITLTPIDPLGATTSLQVTPTSLPTGGTLCQNNLLGTCSQPVLIGNPMIEDFPADGKWVMTYTPNPGFTTNGTPDTFSYTLTNAQGLTSGPFTVQINVLGPPNLSGCQNITISPGTVPGGNQNVPYAGVTFTATGGTGRLDFAEKGTLPAGMTFSNGTLSGTPTESGSFPFFVFAADKNDCAQVTAYDLTILNPPPGISAQGPLSVPADGTVSLLPVAVVSDSAIAPGTLSVQATGVPAGITIAGLKNTNGVITAYIGAACNQTLGMYSATLLVSDGANNPVATTVVVNVVAPQPGGPPLAYPAQVRVAPGQSAAIRPSVPLPAGAAVSRVGVFNNGGRGGYDGTAAVDAAGNVTLTGVGPSGASFTVIVTSVMGCSVTQDSAFIVVLPTYDKCLKDDSSGNFIRFNSQTGDYLLTVCGAGGFSFSGTGTVRISGSVLMLTDTQTDRRVTISYLTNQLTGNATINIAAAPGVFNTIRIVQRNINATCGCS
jgi:hypothetical protein